MLDGSGRKEELTTKNKWSGDRGKREEVASNVEIRRHKTLFSVFRVCLCDGRWLDPGLSPDWRFSTTIYLFMVWLSSKKRKVALVRPNYYTITFTSASLFLKMLHFV